MVSRSGPLFAWSRHIWLVGLGLCYSRKGQYIQCEYQRNDLFGFFSSQVSLLMSLKCLSIQYPC